MQLKSFQNNIYKHYPKLAKHFELIRYRAAHKSVSNLLTVSGYTGEYYTNEKYLGLWNHIKKNEHLHTMWML